MTLGEGLDGGIDEDSFWRGRPTMRSAMSSCSLSIPLMLSSLALKAVRISLPGANDIVRSDSVATVVS